MTGRHADIQGVSHVTSRTRSCRPLRRPGSTTSPGDVVIRARTRRSTTRMRSSLRRRRQDHAQVPAVAGIDMAGAVESSNDPRWKRGDKVIVTGYDIGVSHDGGYAEYVRVPADWVVRRPEGMTAFDAMTLGTAGFTAALAIHLMQLNGCRPTGQVPSP